MSAVLETGEPMWLGWPLRSGKPWAVDPNVEFKVLLSEAAPPSAAPALGDVDAVGGGQTVLEA
jgi:hypothetical protein